LTVIPRRVVMGGVSKPARLSLVAVGFVGLLGTLLLIYWARTGAAPPPAAKGPTIMPPPPVAVEPFQLPSVSDAQAEEIRTQLQEIEDRPKVRRRDDLLWEQRRAAAYVRAFKEELSGRLSPERNEGLRRLYERMQKEEPLLHKCFLLALYHSDRGEVAPEIGVPRLRTPLRSEELDTLVVGKTKEEVRKVLGAPVRIERGRDAGHEGWVYGELTPNSRVTVLQFRRDGEKVTVDSVVYELSTTPDLVPLPSRR
jgi:hypothetical protein